MTLTMALNNALSGLNANQRALAVISQNIANANTEGYSRQSAELAAQYIEGVGVGVKVEDVVRQVDLYLQRSIRNQTSFVGRGEIVSGYMDRLQVLLGEPGETNSLDEYVTNFFDSLQSLAETPERTSFREGAVDSGIILAREVSDIATGLEDLRFQADLDIQEAVRIVNEELRNLDNLNTALARAEALGNPKAGLLDQQDAALERVAEYMEISVSTQQNGGVFIYGPRSLPLLTETLRQVRYNGVDAVETLINDEPVNQIEIVSINERGLVSGEPTVLVGSGVEEGITSLITNGKLKGLLDLRDRVLPGILEQMDELAANMRDAFNVIHNQGSSYPGTNLLEGTRTLTAETRSNWEGGVTIAVLNQDGTPIYSPYPDETHTGVRPLHLDLTFLDGGNGAGEPDVQTILDEINNHFWPPPVKTTLGILNSIQLVSDINELPGAAAAPAFSFDFDLENITGMDADFFVTRVQVLDSTGADITSVNTPPPQVTVNAVNTYTTTAGSAAVTVAATAHGLAVGDRIFMTDPVVAVNGIVNADLTGYFEITGVTANSFTINARSPATAAGSVSVAAITATPKWDTVEPGEKGRIRDAGVVDIDFGGAPGSPYFDIIVDVGVDDRQGTPTQIDTGRITYRVFNDMGDLLNDRYNATDTTGAAAQVVANTDQPLLMAILVDEDGNVIERTEGEYAPDVEGHIKIITNDPSHTVAIQDNGSKELGLLTVSPQIPGTERGFSHYFELNNFFESNVPTSTGDTVNGSAINMRVEQRFEDNANLIALGDLTQSNQPADPEALPLYTYERFIGDNGQAQRLAALGFTPQSFNDAGGLSPSDITYGAYAGQILGFTAAQAVRAETDNRDNNILLDGLTERSDAFSGVNIDEEMANTIIFQNAYSASARIITVTNELFSTLLSTFN